MCNIHYSLFVRIARFTVVHLMLLRLSSERTNQPCVQAYRVAQVAYRHPQS